MKQLEKNYIYNIIYQFLILLLPLITAPYLARTIGPNGVGVYSYTYSVAQYFLLFAMLGISNHGNRSIAAVRDDKKKMEKTFWSIRAIQTITFSIAVVLYILYLLFFNIDYKTIACIQLIYILSGAFDISWFFFGTEQFKITVTRNFIIKILTVMLIFLLVHNKNDLVKYTLIISLGFLFSQIYLWKHLFNQISFCKISFKDLAPHIKPIIVLFVPVIAYSIYKILDKIMLGNMSSYTQVGFFENSEKIINIPMGIITALGTVMLPRISNLASKGDSKTTLRYFDLSLRFVSFIGSGVGFGLMGVSMVLAPVYLGASFADSGPIIMLLGVTVIFIAWANVMRTQYLIPYHLDRVYLSSTLIGALFNLIINVLLIPMYAAKGAAVGTIVAEFSVMFFQAIGLRKHIPIFRMIKSCIPYLVFGSIMAFCVYFVGAFLGTSFTTLCIQIFSGIIIYLSMCFIYFLFFCKDDFGKIILEVIRNLKA